MKKRTRTGVVRLANQLMRSRIMMPEAQVGEYGIKHIIKQPGDKLPLSSLRDSYLTGIPAVSLPVVEPTVIHELYGPEGTWMTDFPCELFQMHEEFVPYAHGNVLIGGLGLGILSRMVTELRLNVMTKRRPKVNRIVVVERQPEVIELTSKYAGKDVEIVQADLFDYIRNLQPGTFDSALLDVWQGTGEWVWQTQVVPLRRLIGSKIREVHAWREEMMWNQVYGALFRVIGIRGEILRHRSTCHYYAFNQGAPKDLDIMRLPEDCDPHSQEGLSMLLDMEQANRNNGLLDFYARRFLQDVGTPWWEKTYGPAWDAAWNAETGS